MSFNWSPEVLRVARRLYLDLGLSASESAAHIGVTRSALIAKAHRMGWAQERVRGGAAANLVRGGRALARALRPARPPRPVSPRLTAPPDASAVRPRPWLERRAGQCAYPVGGDGEAVMSCCAPSGAATYCRTHRAAMYLRRTPARQKALERIAEWVDRLERPVADAGSERAGR
jgi:hypothetical protein